MAVFKYKKLGGGSFRFPNGKKVKYNESFIADENDIPKSMKDLFEKGDEVKNPDKAPEKLHEKPPKPEPPKGKTRAQLRKEAEEKKKADEKKAKKAEKAPAKIVDYYFIDPIDDKGEFFNVVNVETGEPANPEPLSEEEAVEAAKALNDKD